MKKEPIMRQCCDCPPGKLKPLDLEHFSYYRDRHGKRQFHMMCRHHRIIRATAQRDKLRIERAEYGWTNPVYKHFFNAPATIPERMRAAMQLERQSKLLTTGEPT